MDYLWLLVLAALVFFSAFFSAAELSLFSLSRMHVRRIVKQGMPGSAAIERLKKDPAKTITIILVGNTFVTILASAITTGVAIEAFGDVGVGIATGALTLVLLTFGEIMPKTLAIKHAESVARSTAPWLERIGVVLSPIVIFFKVIQGMFIKHDVAAPIVTEKDVRYILEVSAEENVISPKEHEMMKNMLDFKDTPVKTALIPFAELKTISSDMSVQQAKDLAVGNGYSRYPIVVKETGRIIGIMHVKQIDTLTKEGKGGLPIGNFVPKEGPLLVSENERLDKLFKKMQKGHIHMAVVVDDKWNHLGIISFEDIIEEIIGEEPEPKKAA